MNSSNPKKRNFLIQGSILAMAGIFCRIIGMIYRLPLVDVIGTKGNGYYTSAYSIYNILLVASSYSLPTAMSRIISERLAQKKPEDARRAMQVAFIYSTVIGALMSAVMFFGADKIAGIMHKPFLSYVLMTLAPTIWIMAYLGILRGFFQGTDNMVPTAFSQILEQVINAFVSVIMAKILFSYGEKANLLYGEEEYSYAFGAAGGTIGTGAGALLALLFFILIYCLYGRSYLQGKNAPYAAAGSGRPVRRANAVRSTGKESYGTLFKVLLYTLTPILFSAMVTNINTVVDDFIFSDMMEKAGMAASVVMLWGIFGEYRIIFNIPVAISNSYNASIIPSLARAVAEKDRTLIIRKIALGIRFTMIIAIPACVGMFALAEPICKFLFPTETSGILVNVLRIGSPAVVFYSYSTITNGVLHGLGHYREPLVNAMISLAVHVAVLVILMMISPGIYSVMAATLVMGLVAAVLNWMSILKYVHYHQYVSKTFVIPFVVSALMGVAAYLTYSVLSNSFTGDFCQSRWGTGLILMISIFVAAAVYFVALFLVRPFRADELIQMPFGRTIYSFAKKLHLMK